MIVLGATMVRAQTPAPAAALDPVVADLLATNPTTPGNILRVVTTLVDLHNAPAAKPLMQKLLAMSLDDDQLAALYTQYGSALFLKLKTDPGLEPEGPQFAAAVMAAIDKKYHDPDKIAQAIARLGSDSPAERAAATAQLRLGHTTAAAALWNVLADANRADEHAAVRRALVDMEGDALGPTIAAYDSDDAAVRLQAIAVLGQLADPRAKLALYRAAFAAGVADDEVQAARAALHDPTIDGPTAAAKLFAAAQTLLVPKAPLPADIETNDTLWFWDAPKHAPASGPVPVPAAALEWAVRWAGEAQAILGPDHREARQLFFTALVERSLVRIAVGMPIEQATAGVREAFGQLSPAALEDLMQSTAADGHEAVAALAADAINISGDREVITRHAPSISPLVAATQHADRRLRYSALAAVMKLAPAEAYPGSSQVAESLAFVLGASGRPRAIAADARPEVAGTLAGLLTAAGYESLAVSNANELVRAAIASPDVELVIVDLNLASVNSGQVLSRLHRDARTANVPIGVVVGSREIERARMLALRDPLVEGFVRPYDVPVAQQMVQRLTSLASRHRTSAEERLAQARQTLQWIAEIAKAESSPYTLSTFEPALVEALNQNELAAEASAVLAHYGTHDSQRALADVANQGSRPLATRQAAASALADNIRQHGTRLTTTEIAYQYDRYNASEREPAEVQALLTAILDAIEARAARSASS